MSETVMVLPSYASSKVPSNPPNALPSCSLLSETVTVGIIVSSTVTVND